MGYRAGFDYGQMAREAARERDALKARLEKRQAEGPGGAEPGGWEKGGRMLYEMYLEQRSTCRELERRAGLRAAGA